MSSSHPDFDAAGAALSARGREPDPAFARHDVTFPSAPWMLTGHLWIPPGAGPFRAVVFNHGSERDPTPGALLARFFNAHGFVLFVPIRRGHGKSPGPYVGDRIEQASASERDAVLVAELERQVEDVLAALAYLRTRPEVRGDAIAVSGSSFGGIEALLAAERDGGFQSAVDFAGGAMLWGQNELLRERLKRAATRAVAPVFFIQVENDFDTAPTRVLAAEMARLEKLHAARIYPPHGTTPWQGHRFCRLNPTAWGNDVPAWFDRTMP